MALARRTIKRAPGGVDRRRQIGHEPIPRVCDPCCRLEACSVSLTPHRISGLP
jgi:hypothetical protein